MKMVISVIGLLIAAAVFPSCLAAQEAENTVAGVVGFMNGNLVAKRTDAVVLLAPNSKIYIGDELNTSEESYAQIKMNDGTKMVLSPLATVKIINFHFAQGEPKADNEIIHLIKGGIRTLSGWISKRGNPNAYQLKTSTATIGIRGTDFTARLCQNDCSENEMNEKNKENSPVPSKKIVNDSSSKTDAGQSIANNTALKSDNGVYVTVHEGAIILSQGEAGKSIQVMKGDTGFANQFNVKKLPAIPKFMESIKAADTNGTSKKVSPQNSSSGCVVK